jgi:CHAT domain-containing protein
MAGNVPLPRQSGGAARLSAKQLREDRRAPLEALLREGRDSLSQGRHAEAEGRFELLWKTGVERKEYDLAARGKGNAGRCQFFRHEYQSAVQSFLEAYRLAMLGGDRSAASICEANLASVYSEMGEVDAAVQWTARSLQSLSERDREHLPELQIQMASLRARQQNLPEALALFRSAIDSADNSGNAATYALGWNRLGEELLRAGPARREAAEAAFLEAFRARSLHGLPLAGSYANLARVRLESGDAASAAILADRAVELSETPNVTPARDVFRLRGQVRIRQNRLAEALDDLRVAVRLERAWRWSAPAADRVRAGAQSIVDGACRALVEAGNLQYERTRKPALIRETFEAAEENRSNSLRLIFGERSTGELPAVYWEAIGKLQRAEIAALQGSSVEAAQAARAEVMRLEAGLDDAAALPPADLLDRVTAALAADSALLSFDLQDAASWLWAVDRQGIALYRLADRNTLTPQIVSAARAIREDLPEARIQSAAAYRALFGQLPPRFRDKRRWLLALDSDLWTLPVAALVDDSGSAPAYLAERHVIELIPGAAVWLEARERPRRYSRLFVGLGDPIFNQADPRFPETGSSKAFNPAAILPISRLVASGKEVNACARAWDGESTLLEAATATREKLLEQLRRNPAAVHLATHFLLSAGRSPAAMIALGAGGASGTELLSAMEIARWRIQAGVVVLSGCDSAAGPILPAAGLMGLTRAWLKAGAGAVVASRWPTPDDEGELFRSLYRDLSRNSSDAAAALQSAQAAMLRAGGWRAWFAMGAE